VDSLLFQWLIAFRRRGVGAGYRYNNLRALGGCPVGLVFERKDRVAAFYEWERGVLAAGQGRVLRQARGCVAIPGIRGLRYQVRIGAVFGSWACILAPRFVGSPGRFSTRVLRRPTLTRDSGQPWLPG